MACCPLARGGAGPTEAFRYSFACSQVFPCPQMVHLSLLMKGHTPLSPECV